MRNLLFFVAIIVSVTGMAQEFHWKDSLITQVNSDRKVVLKELAERNYLYTGNLNFNISEGDLSLQYYQPDSTFFTPSEAIELGKARLRNASSLDSAEVLVKMNQYYQMMAEFDKGYEALEQAYNIMIRLLDDENADADVMKQAGFFTLQTNSDQSQAFPYFAGAWNNNTNDSVSLQMMISIYFHFGLFPLADSLVDIALDRFPHAFGPYMFSTQIEGVNLYLKYTQNPQLVNSLCLNQVANLDKIYRLRRPGASNHDVLLSYLLEELLLIMKYQMNISGDSLTPLLPCDKILLNTMRSEYRNMYAKPGFIPRYTLLNALAWTFAIEKEYDSTITYLKKAIHEIRPLGGSYMTTRTTIANSLMALQYLSGDTLSSIATMQSIIDGHDSTGIFAGDYLMLSVLYLRSGQFSNAFNSCNTALKFRANQAAAYRIQAMAKFHLGEKSEAYQLIEKAVEADKNDAYTYSLYAIMYMLDDQPKKAFRYLEAAWYVNNADPDVLSILDEYFAKK